MVQHPNISRAGSFLGSAGLLLCYLQPEIASLQPWRVAASFRSVPFLTELLSPLKSVSPVCFKDTNAAGPDGPACSSADPSQLDDPSRDSF